LLAQTKKCPFFDHSGRGKSVFLGKTEKLHSHHFITGPDYKNHDKRNVPFAAAYTDSELI